MSQKDKRPCPCGSGKKYKNCCKPRRDDLKATPSSGAATLASNFWWPSMILAAVAIYVISQSRTVYNYTENAYWVHNRMLNWLSIVSFIMAGALTLLPPLRCRAVRHLNKLSNCGFREHFFWIGLAFIGIWGWLGFVRYCEYRSFLLPRDTADMVNLAYNFIHYGSLIWTTRADSVLSEHFVLLIPALSPILRIWNSPWALLFLENLIFASAPVAMYCLIYTLTLSSFAGFLGMWLTLATPYMYEILTASLNYASIVALLPWGMLFLYRKRYGLCVLCFALMICATEEVPLTFFGLGIYAIYDLGWKNPKSWLLGLSICILSLGLWYFEMAVITRSAKRSVQISGAMTSRTTLDNMRMFAHLVPEDTPPEKILPSIVYHPFRTLKRGFYPFSKFYAVLRMTFYLGLFCWLALPATIPYLITVVPHILANSGVEPIQFFGRISPNAGYSNFGLHYSAYVLGPLLWATAMGIRSAYQKLAPRNYQGWLLIWVLCISGWGFRYAHRTLNPSWRREWFDAMPRVMAQIPQGARLWTEEYAAPPLSNRRWIKMLGWDGPSAGFQQLFKPDYVLFAKGFVVYAKPPYRDQVLTFWGQHRYRKIADISGIVLLRAPDPLSTPEAVPDWIQLPLPDIKIAKEYAQYVISAPPEDP